MFFPKTICRRYVRICVSVGICFKLYTFISSHECAISVGNPRFIILTIFFCYTYSSFEMKKNKIFIIGSIALISLFAVTGVTKAIFQYTPPTHVLYNQEAQSNYKTFISTDLGISFQYEGGIYKNPVLVKQIGNRVYLYLNCTGKEDPTSGKFVEVLSNNPNDSLSDAIKKQFLQGFSTKDCPIVSPKIDKRTINGSY